MKTPSRARQHMQPSITIIPGYSIFRQDWLLDYICIMLFYPGISYDLYSALFPLLSTAFLQRPVFVLVCYINDLSRMISNVEVAF